MNITINNLNVFMVNGENVMETIESLALKSLAGEVETHLKKELKKEGIDLGDTEISVVVTNEDDPKRDVVERETPKELDFNEIVKKVAVVTYHSYAFCEHLAIYAFLRNQITEDEFKCVTKGIFDASIGNDEALSKEYYDEYDTGTDLPELAFNEIKDADCFPVLENKEGHSYYITKQRGCLVKVIATGEKVHFRLNKMGNGLMNEKNIRENFPAIGVIAPESVLTKYRDQFTSKPVY